MDLEVLEVLEDLEDVRYLPGRRRSRALEGPGPWPPGPPGLEARRILAP